MEMKKVDTKITVCTGATNDKYECLDKKQRKKHLTYQLIKIVYKIITIIPLMVQMYLIREIM